MYDDDRQFIDSYENTNILVTGADGNVGLKVCEFLLDHYSFADQVTPNYIPNERHIRHITMFEGPNSTLMHKDV